jgi:hypothetical protein
VIRLRTEILRQLIAVTFRKLPSSGKAILVRVKSKKGRSVSKDSKSLIFIQTHLTYEQIDGRLRIHAF